MIKKTLSKTNKEAHLQYFMFLGMAIGAAFSGSIAGGFSTAVAVFCHELPHEVGDFAMLLKAGMSFKQAFFYNIISSVLCFLGNALGIWLGLCFYYITSK